MFRSIFAARRMRLAAVLAPAFLFAWSGLAVSQSGISNRDEVRESVVRIEVEMNQGGARQGTGFIINDKRTIATNNHVIEGAKAIYVTFLANGKPTAIPARLIATDPIGDMALIETVIDIYGEPVVLADYDTSPPAKVTAIGYPVAADFVADNNYLPAIAFEPSYTVGSVARTLSNTKFLGGERLIQHTAPINPGNSGGPLFDDCGRVIGINTLRTVPKDSDYAQGIFFAVDIRELHTLLEDNVVTATKADKPCTPGMDTKNDAAPATTKEAEAVMFDRFAACIKSRPCDRAICKSRYGNRVGRVGHWPASRCRRAHVHGRAQLQIAEGFRGRKRVPTLQHPAAVRIREELRPQAGGSARRRQHEGPARHVRPGAHQGRSRLQGGIGTRRLARGRTDKGIWTATVSNESGAALVVSCDVSGSAPGAGVILLGAVAGKRDRWTGTRAVQMTIDSYAEPLRLDLKTSDADLTAGVKHVETVDTRGWLKELVGKFSVGSVVTFEEPKVSLDETFSLGGAAETLAPCLKAKFVEQQQQQPE